ncbi:MAG TPA: hypothetical protein ENK54_03335 [Thiotrichales bacterium]|nr:hypothetical protein [Thiotrichales bacterium]
MTTLHLSWRLVIALLALAGLGGCIPGQEAVRPDAELQAIDLIQQKRFAEARVLLEGDQREESLHLLQQVQEMARRYDAEMADEILEARLAGDWGRAFELLNRGLANLPDGLALNQVREILEQDRQRELRRLERQRLLLRAEWLERTLPVQEAIAAMRPDDPATLERVAALRRESEEVARLLEEEGIAALDNLQPEQAQTFLELAVRLAASSRAEQLLQELDEKMELAREEAELRRKRQQRSWQQQQELRRKRAAARLNEQIHQALIDGDLVDVRKLLAELRKLQPHAPELAELELAVNEAIDAQVKELLEEGTRAYGAGNIREARFLWEQALRLRPDDEEIKARIQRAQRVLHKVEELRGGKR